MQVFRFCIVQKHAVARPLILNTDKPWPYSPCNACICNWPFGCEWLGHEEWQSRCKWHQQCTVLETGQANKAREQTSRGSPMDDSGTFCLAQHQGHIMNARIETVHNKMCVATTNPHRMLVAISHHKAMDMHVRDSKFLSFHLILVAQGLLYIKSSISSARVGCTNKDPSASGAFKFSLATLRQSK